MPKGFRIATKLTTSRCFRLALPLAYRPLAAAVRLTGFPGVTLAAALAGHLLTPLHLSESAAASGPFGGAAVGYVNQ
jgi:hypothetical protein